MMKILDIGAPNVIGLEVDGKIELEDMERLKTVVAERLEEVDKLRVYVEVVEMGGVSLTALWEDLKMARGTWDHWTHKAVVSDKKWMGKFTGVVDKFFPNIKLKHFTWDQKEEAREWVRNEP